MKCYPIIYTRTDCCDYYANFHVIPNFADANEIRPYILSATVGLDPTAKKIKKLIFANDRYCVFGYIGFIKDLFEAEADNIQQFSRDNKGRAIYGFFGFVTQDTASGAIPLLRIEECLDAFKQYIIPVWRNTVPESTISSSVTLEETPCIFGNIQEVTVHGNCRFYSEDGGLFETLLSNWFSAKNDISYCSWIEDYSQIRNCLFRHVVTTDNAVFRLNCENQTAHTVRKSEVDTINSGSKKRTSLSAAEELQMMMLGVKTVENQVSEPMDELSDIQPDIEEDQQIQSQNTSDYQSFYQSNEMPSRIYVKASKKKSTTKNYRIPQEPVCEQKNIAQIKQDEFVKNVVIAACVTVAAAGAGTAAAIAAKKRQQKLKEAIKQKEGPNYGE